MGPSDGDWATAMADGTLSGMGEQRREREEASSEDKQPEDEEEHSEED